VQKLPKLNKVAVDNEPEPKPKRERDIVPYYIILVVLLCRLILDCCSVQSPLITSWESWWITFVVMFLVGKVAFYLEKKYDNEKISYYYFFTCGLLWGFLSVSHVPTSMFIVMIIWGTFLLFQFLLTRKK
jgi:hypothetical protein